MSGPHRAGLALGALLALTTSSPAQVPASARAAEAQFKLSLKDAVRTADADPAKGAEKLRQLLKQIESDVALPADRRSQLARVVKDRLRIAEAGPTWVHFRYVFTTRWAWLRWLVDPLVRRVFLRDIRARLRGLRDGAERKRLGN